jgi:hypothetical protein
LLVRLEGRALSCIRDEIVATQFVLFLIHTLVESSNLGNIIFAGSGLGRALKTFSVAVTQPRRSFEKTLPSHPFPLRRMFTSNSWTPSKRRTFSTSTVPEEEDLYSAHSRDKSPFSHSRNSPLHNLSRNLYIRYFLSLLLGLFIGRTILAPTTNYHLPSIPYGHGQQISPGPDRSATQDPRVSNATLGTAAIIALNSASRPDRRDYLALMASISDIKLTYMDAWTKKPVEKALPNEHNPGLKDVEFACWRTHADAWRRVVEEGWETAMIIEDDADWDGGIHESMAVAWKGLIEITRDPLAANTATSYLPILRI